MVVGGGSDSEAGGVEPIQVSHYIVTSSQSVCLLTPLTYSLTLL